ncbi:MAG: hypothetical protein R2807_04845 [Chitinophagales bacterium]
MKKRYILLVLFFLFALYLVWCNISIIYTRKPSAKTIPLVEKIHYNSDSFFISNSTLIWQGFYHDWTYNHRVNRLGDWVQNIPSESEQFRGLFNHAAASGIGADVLSYNTFFTYLHSSKIKAFTSTVHAIVRGREATSTTKILSVKGKIPAQMRAYNHATILLNGFDIYCRSKDDGKIMGTGKADKLSDLIIEVNHLKWKNDSFEFDLKISLGADCDSPECLNFTPGDNEWFDYNFTVAYQIIAYNEGVHVTDKNIQQSYRWFKPFKTRPSIDPNEIYRTQKAMNNLKIKGIPGYQVGIPAIHTLKINLPKDEGGLLRKRLETPHMLSLDVAINNFRYDVHSGICTYNADLFFKNWKPNMPLLSYGNNGKALINLGVRLLQIQDASAIVEYESVKGKIDWQTTEVEERNANDPNSIKSFVFVK